MGDHRDRERAKRTDHKPKHLRDEGISQDVEGHSLGKRKDAQPKYGRKPKWQGDDKDVGRHDC